MSEMLSDIDYQNKIKCDRCGDLYYHPKTLIEDATQRAKEWEDVASKLEFVVMQLQSENTKLKQVCEIMEKALEWYQQEAPHLCYSRLDESISSIFGSKDPNEPACINRVYPARQALAEAKKVMGA